MNNIDPKSIGVPNINFTIIDEKDDRAEIYRQQRLERGFDDSETWSLSGTLANFLLPRLKRFNELDNGVRSEEFKEHMRNFILLLELEARDGGSRIFTEEESKITEKGLTAFKEIFFQLWW